MKGNWSEVTPLRVPGTVVGFRARQVIQTQRVLDYMLSNAPITGKISASRDFCREIRVKISASRDFRREIRVEISSSIDFHREIRVEIFASRDFRRDIRAEISASRDFRRVTAVSVKYEHMII